MLNLRLISQMRIQIEQNTTVEPPSLFILPPSPPRSTAIQLISMLMRVLYNFSMLD